jgi:hypothetical protein
MSAFAHTPIVLSDCYEAFEGDKKVTIVPFGNVSFRTTSDWQGANIARFITEPKKGDIKLN